MCHSGTFLAVVVWKLHLCLDGQQRLSNPFSWKKQKIVWEKSLHCVEWLFKISKGLCYASTFSWVPWHFNKSQRLNVPERNWHTTLTPHQPSSWYLFLLLCHEQSKKGKALPSLQHFLQKNPFNGKILPEAAFNYLFLLLSHEHSKKGKALASLPTFLAKQNPFNGKILKLSLLFIFTFVPWAFKKSKGLGFPSMFFAKKSFQWQNSTRSCLNYLLLCHEFSKKEKAQKLDKGGP